MAVAAHAETSGTPLEVAPDLVSRIAALANGHPHLLQLLGSHVVEHEQSDPDGLLDYRDLLGALRRLCYEDRARVYDSTLHLLEVEGKREYLETLLKQMAWVFPAQIDRDVAIDLIGKDAVHWLVERDILSTTIPDSYGLSDEFIRIRLLLDEAESEAERRQVEEGLLAGEVIDAEMLDEYADPSEAAYDEDDEDDTDD